MVGVAGTRCPACGGPEIAGRVAVAADADLAPRQGYLRTLRALARSRPAAGQAAGAMAPPRAGHRTRGA